LFSLVVVVPRESRNIDGIDGRVQEFQFPINVATQLGLVQPSFPKVVLVIVSTQLGPLSEFNFSIRRPRRESF